MRKQEKVWFRETLTLGDYLVARIRREQTFYHAESLSMRVARRLLRLPTGSLVDRIYYGDIKHSTGIRKRAYQRGLDTIVTHPLPLERLSPGFTADMDLLASKFMLDDLFSRFEFQAMAMQFAHENPLHDVRLVADIDLFPALEPAVTNMPVRGRRKLQWLHYIMGVLIAPLYLWHLMRKHKANDEAATVSNEILCEVDSMTIVDMFCELLQPEYTPVFFISPHYLQHFGPFEASRLGLLTHSVGPTKRTRLLLLLRNWLRLALSEAPALARGGVLFFDFLKSLAQGILITPVATDCTYLTFEHMSTVKAVRNELLRATGNTSVFVPFNTYAIDHFFTPEYRYNYDVLCSPCALLEQAYRLQQAATRVILRTGAYSPHRKVVQDSAASQRHASLAEFKDDCVAVTILSAGVLPGNVSAELQLKTLATELASRQGVKVFIRQKPVQPEPRFADFYEDIKANPDIKLTHAEYKLFDFLQVTDIFVTSNSSSAVDLCGAGGDFFAVDFWHDRDLYLWQTAVDDVFIAPETAADAIMAWVKDTPPGTRARHHERMDTLRRLITYEAGSFEDYRHRVHAQLDPWLTAPRLAKSAIIERATT